MSDATISTYTVSGMTCEHCAAAVREELSHLDGVTAVDVEVTAGRVTVTSASALDASDVAAAVDEAGYRLVS